MASEFTHYIERAKHILHNGGIGTFSKKILRFASRSSKEVLAFPGIVQKAKAITQQTPLDDLIDFAFTVGGGVMQPLQRKPEVKALLTQLRATQPKVCVEIGTAKGGNLFLFTRAVHPEALICSVDLMGGQFGGGYPAWKIPFFKRLALPTQRLELVRGDSHATETFEALKEKLAGAEIDFLFIDGDHTYEGVKKDFEMYSPLVKDDGIVCFHDIVPHGEDSSCKVDEYWNEMKKDYSYKEFIADPNQRKMGIGFIQPLRP